MVYLEPDTVDVIESIIVENISREASKSGKLIYDYSDLKRFGIWKSYDLLRASLYKSEQRTDCVLIQGAAFVVKGYAYLLLGVGGIDFLDSLSQLKGVDGVIGNGNALFVSRDFRKLYSAHSRRELEICYEIDGGSHNVVFLEEACAGPAVFIIRSFRSLQEYESAKLKRKKVIFEESSTFACSPIRFNSRLRGRLRDKFLSTTSVVHCARRPTLLAKECLFDSREEVSSALMKFEGWFVLSYTLWNQSLCDAVGMENTRRLAKQNYNPTDPITPHFLDIANQIRGKGQA